MSRFAPFDRVIVVSLNALRAEDVQRKGMVTEVHGDGKLVVDLDDGTLVSVHPTFVRPDNDYNPTDTEIYGAGV